MTLLIGLPEGEHMRKMENEKQNSVIDVFYSKGIKSLLILFHGDKYYYLECCQKAFTYQKNTASLY